MSDKKWNYQAAMCIFHRFLKGMILRNVASGSLFNLALHTQRSVSQRYAVTFYIPSNKHFTSENLPSRLWYQTGTKCKRYLLRLRINSSLYEDKFSIAALYYFRLPKVVTSYSRPCGPDVDESEVLSMILLGKVRPLINQNFDSLSSSCVYLNRSPFTGAFHLKAVEEELYLDAA